MRRSAPARDAARAAVNVPGLISLLRVPLALAFILVHDTAIRIAIVLFAALTDWADGWWARTRGQQTAMGALLDPLTDKVFVVSALVGFTASRVLAPWQLAVFVARDVFVAAGAAVVALLRLRVPLRARFPGKVLTNVQIAAVVTLLLVPRAATPLTIVAAGVSAWAIADYAVAGLRSLRRPAAPG